ncbi:MULTISPECIES: cysteine hydrolase [Morganellaceae]|uniref:Isochorismatase n=1 Tax=Morganella morganii TaxID=582 RepID=A0A8I0U6D8_MORMO|nr:cysteine hydrolase [Morganella morganii]MBE8612954.1 isochorismatase [Morganella morganii]
MSEKKAVNRRTFISQGAKLAAGTTALGILGMSSEVSAKENKSVYDEPAQYGMPRNQVNLVKMKTGLVVIDPQVDFLSPSGVSWPVMKESITENKTVEHIEALFKAAKEVDIPVVISPHYYYPTDNGWEFGGPGEHFMHDTGMFKRQGQYTMEGFENSGADFMPEFKKYIFDGKTIIASPHKIFGPESNDVILQLRKRGVQQILLAGMAANLCVESHMREFIEQGFEVIVIKDATAGPKIPEGDGYLAALTNYRIIASDLWTTDKAVSELRKMKSF